MRDSKVASAVKKMYDNTCQICRERLIVSLEGEAYSEAAHIQAVGKPHLGIDRIDNVLCLCPNCHALFDRGALQLTDTLDVIDGITGRFRARLRKPRGTTSASSLRASTASGGLTGSPRTGTGCRASRVAPDYSPWHSAYGLPEVHQQVAVGWGARGWPCPGPPGWWRTPPGGTGRPGRCVPMRRRLVRGELAVTMPRLVVPEAARRAGRSRCRAGAPRARGTPRRGSGSRSGARRVRAAASAGSPPGRGGTGPRGGRPVPRAGGRSRRAVRRGRRSQGQMRLGSWSSSRGIGPMWRVSATMSQSSWGRPRRRRTRWRPVRRAVVAGVSGVESAMRRVAAWVKQSSAASSSSCASRASAMTSHGAGSLGEAVRMPEMRRGPPARGRTPRGSRPGVLDQVGVGG